MTKPDREKEKRRKNGNIMMKEQKHMSRITCFVQIICAYTIFDVQGYQIIIKMKQTGFDNMNKKID